MFVTAVFTLLAIPSGSWLPVLLGPTILAIGLSLCRMETRLATRSRRALVLTVTAQLLICAGSIAMVAIDRAMFSPERQAQLADYLMPSTTLPPVTIALLLWHVAWFNR